MKLNQVLAIEGGVKTKTANELTELYKQVQKEELFNGFVKTYRPKDDDPTLSSGERLPPEGKPVTLKASAVVAGAVVRLQEWFDLAAMRDLANCSATADVVVDGTTVVANAPVTYLLFLEKRVTDLLTFVSKLPRLSPTETWTYNSAQDVYSTSPTDTVRTKKVTRPMVLYPATPEHPAQVKEVTEDVVAGTWTTTKYSTALPASAVNATLLRLEALLKAIKIAREQANSIDVVMLHPGKDLFAYAFAPIFGA